MEELSTPLPGDPLLVTHLMEILRSGIAGASAQTKPIRRENAGRRNPRPWSKHCSSPDQKVRLAKAKRRKAQRLARRITRRTRH